ncbi:MAG: hypothetical protein ACT4OK_10795 [Gemmobacter sp.]
MKDRQHTNGQGDTFALRTVHFLNASRLLNGSETKVFLNIFVLSNAHGLEWIQLSLEQLMSLADLSEGAVRRALHALECRGLIYHSPHTNRYSRSWAVDYGRLAELGAVIH